MKNRTLYTVIFFTAVVVLCLLIFGPKNAGFTVVSTIPKAKASGIAPENSVVVKYSLPLDVVVPYESFTIIPRTEGSVAIENNSLIFKPTNKLLGNTKYTINIKTATSASGKTLESFDFTFTTAEQTMTDFEQQLPFIANDYTVEKLSDGSIILIILSSTPEQTTREALSFLKSKGIDTDKVSVQLSAASKNQ